MQSATRQAPSTRARALAFVRTSRLVLQRSGAGGAVELVLARAAPRILSARRAWVLRSTTAGGTLHPELDPQVRRASSPELVALFSELAAGGEPEITPLDAAELEARFAAGDELWLFHRDGRVAHVRWTSSQPVPGPGFALPLGPRERAYRSVVTPPEARRSGVARAASEHVRAALAEEGVEALLMLVNGFNRRFHAGLLRAGHEQVARLRVLTVLGRSWLRVDPATPEHAALLTERGIAIGRFRRL